MKRVKGDLISERAIKESIIADRDKLLLEKAALTEKAKIADTLQVVTDKLDQIKDLFEKSPREDLQELVNQVRICVCFDFHMCS